MPKAPTRDPEGHPKTPQDTPRGDARLTLHAAGEIAAIEIALAERLAAVTSHAARVSDLCRDYGLPESTFRSIVAEGRGPRTFTLGRLIYCRRSDWIAWLDRLAEAGGTGPLSPTAKARAA
jgi:hypothetical protein